LRRFVGRCVEAGLVHIVVVGFHRVRPWRACL
jgi:hypothetical protein